LAKAVATEADCKFFSVSSSGVCCVCVGGQGVACGSGCVWRVGGLGGVYIYMCVYMCVWGGGGLRRVWLVVG
jgi:hypothetical protein